jgi:hypothetical protein
VTTETLLSVVFVRKSKHKSWERQDVVSNWSMYFDIVRTYLGGMISEMNDILNQQNSIVFPWKIVQGPRKIRGKDEKIALKFWWRCESIAWNCDRRFCNQRCRIMFSMPFSQFEGASAGGHCFQSIHLTAEAGDCFLTLER